MCKRLCLLIGLLFSSFLGYGDSSTQVEIEFNQPEAHEEQPTLFEALEMLIHKASKKDDMQAEANDLEFQEEELASPVNFDRSVLSDVDD